MNPQSLKHDSITGHVAGKSVYIDDMDVGSHQLIGRVVYSRFASALIEEIDFSALTAAGCVVVTSKDIPGINQVGPVVHDEPCLAEGEVTFIGQAILLFTAHSVEEADALEKQIVIKYQPREAVTTLHDAMQCNLQLAPERVIQRGNPDEMLERAPYVIEGSLETGAQEHWYLETQSALAVPGEGNEMLIYASSQNPAETQAIVAEVMGIRRNEVTVEVRRMGGAFGGKETQANPIAAWAALLARASGRPVKMRLFRDDDQIMTGKRHRFYSTWRLAFDQEGKILAYTAVFNSDAGASTDLSWAIMERALFHAENAYYIPHIRVTGRCYKTNLPSNTAFRGFGGPQGMAVIENAIDRMARYLGMDAAMIRQINFYRTPKAVETPYGQQLSGIHLDMMFEQLMQSSDYNRRREDIRLFNQNTSTHKRGLAITPVKFGISFTTSFLNQAGALVHIYRDGSIQVNHGGTEMGQGLYAKIQGIAASEFGISPHNIRVSATNTSKVPNASATAASSGSDLNGMAVRNAVTVLKARLKKVAMDLLASKGIEDVAPCDLIFGNDTISLSTDPQAVLPFTEVVQKAYVSQVSLSTTGFYKTPGIFFDRASGKGNPFHYFAYGMAVSEVETDVFTGMYRLLRTDILHDTGNSLNPGIDFGQVEGGFIQGVGWCTTEEIKWDNEGRLLTHSPDTYKIPTIDDIPVDFRVSLLEGYPNDGTIHGSKAVGEPPFMLALSVWLAIKDAVSAVGNHIIEPVFSLPATAEVVLMSIEEVRRNVSGKK